MPGSSCVILSLMTPPPPRSTLFPYTTLFRSYLLTGDRYYAEEMAFWANYAMVRTYPGDGLRGSQGIIEFNEVRGYGRSEEHTSELQSLRHLLCRLLLEKKK